MRLMYDSYTVRCGFLYFVLVNRCMTRIFVVLPNVNLNWYETLKTERGCPGPAEIKATTPRLGHVTAVQLLVIVTTGHSTSPGLSTKWNACVTITTVTTMRSARKDGCGISAWVQIHTYVRLF